MATYGEVTITGTVSSGNGEVWIALVSITGGVPTLTLLGSTDAVQQVGGNADPFAFQVLCSNAPIRGRSTHSKYLKTLI